MIRIHDIAIFILIFVMYSNVLLYLYIVGDLSIPPFVFHLLYVIILFILAITVNKNQLFLHPVIVFMIFMIGISGLSFLIHPETINGSITLATEAYLIVFMMGLYFIFSLSPRSILIAQYAILFSGIVSVVINVYDFLHPFAMLPLELANPGRASGFYVNPNGSGIALLLALLLTINIVSSKYREILIIYFTLGIVLTVSRGAILGLFLIIIFFVRYKQMYTRRLIPIIAVFLIALPLTAKIMLDIAFDSNQFDVANIAQRLDWFSTFGKSRDFSENERIRVANKALAVMEENALLGVGISKIRSWNVLPHNMYLYFGVQYGVLGLLIYPLFLMACVARGWWQNRAIFLPFVVVMLFLGLVSHNMMESYFIFIASALVAAMGNLSVVRAQGPKATHRDEMVPT